MSTRFSHLTRDPFKFWLDLSSFLDFEFYNDDNWNQHKFFTDNHEREFLIPTMVIILNYLSSHELEKDISDDYNYEHFTSSCLSYIEYINDIFEMSQLNFFIEKNEILDNKFIFDEDWKIIDFKIFVENENVKNNLIELFLKIYEYWKKQYSNKFKNINLVSNDKLKLFLNKFIVVEVK